MLTGTGNRVENDAAKLIKTNKSFFISRSNLKMDIKTICCTFSNLQTIISKNVLLKYLLIMNILIKENILSTLLSVTNI